VSSWFTVSNFAAVLAITADSACVWATPPPISVWDQSRYGLSSAGPVWTGRAGATTDTSTSSTQASPFRVGVGGTGE
jgi:hypothetical protein